MQSRPAHRRQVGQNALLSTLSRGNGWGLPWSTASAMPSGSQIEVSIMRGHLLFLARLGSTVGVIILSLVTAQSRAQAATPPTDSQRDRVSMRCNGAPILDPFKGPLAGPGIPAGLLPIGKNDKSTILSSGLPCQENVTTFNKKNPSGNEDTGLANLQRGFDFYSWRTFIALNSPADGTSIEDAQPDTRTRWEDMSNFKQLFDVMLPAGLQPPKWPTDKAGMEAERERLIPPECSALHRKMPDRTIIKMIEESFNEPFKTGPLIDQQGHYAIFDILMNRQMFDYIVAHHLNTKAGQMNAANSALQVDFPAGANRGDMLGAFMIKVAWKILSPKEVRAKTFHMLEALVWMPPSASTTKRPCLPETLGLVGFHAVHKTASRPQWIWTTFEYNKNVPDRNEVATGKLDGPYNFFSVNCKNNCPEQNSTPPRPWDPDPALRLRFRQDDSFKSQIVREVPLTNAAKNMNTVFHSMLPADSVWQNYMLISTQWPSAFSCTSLHSQSSSAAPPRTDFLKQPDMTCSPAPTFLANSTLETYSQGNVPLGSSSCIGCHSNAVDFQTRPSDARGGELYLNQSDFTYILEKAQ